MALLAGARFTLTGRYHDVIQATMVGCPSIAFASTSHKVHGVCELLEGLAGTPYDGTDLWTCSPEIIQRARGYLKDNAGLRDRLRAAATRLGEAAGEVGVLVRGCLKSR
jgi:hypothetical protein